MNYKTIKDHVTREKDSYQQLPLPLETKNKTTTHPSPLNKVQNSNRPLPFQQSAKQQLTTPLAKKYEPTAGHSLFKEVPNNN